MGRHKIDRIDLHILAELQADGRITNVELAQRTRITAPPCLRRVRALEKAGFIRGYHADLDPKALGYELTAFAFVGLSSQAEADLKAFEDQIRAWPLVRECFMLSGEVDFVLKCVARDLGEFQAFVTEKLTAVKNVASVKTALAIRPSKTEPGVPIDLEAKSGRTITAD
jgi:DNA-binding Lrp family transcriptional regulator